jgi:hypothetical protein
MGYHTWLQLLRMRGGCPKHSSRRVSILERLSNQYLTPYMAPFGSFLQNPLRVPGQSCLWRGGHGENSFRTKKNTCSFS